MSNKPRLAHVILTRFNCRFIGGDFPTRNQPGWLEHRFKLFERYCLPTLKAQTSTNFEWFLYFDTETPRSFLDRAYQLLEGYPHFHVRLVELYSGEWLLNDIASHLGDRCDWLLSTRLDNDDGLNVDFVRQLQAQIRFAEAEALNFPKGLVLTRDRIYVSRQASNAFLSVSEPYAGFRTALHAPHKEMARHMPLRDITAPPMWLQVIHEANVSNKLRGRRLLRKDAPAGFADVIKFDADSPAESPARIMAENVTLSLAWSLRDAASQGLRTLRAAVKARAAGL